MMTIVPFATGVVCINHLVKDLICNEYYAVVINLNQTFNFSAVRLNHRYLGRLNESPTVYIVNLEEITLKKFLEMRNFLGFYYDTKYIFLGDSIHSLIIPEATPNLISNSIFINIRNGDIHSKISGTSWGLHLELINLNESGNCQKNLTNVGFQKQTMIKRHIELKICFTPGEPYVFFDGINNATGIEIETWEILVEILNVSAKFLAQPYPTDDFLGRQVASLYDGTCDALVSYSFNIDTVDITIPFFYDLLSWIIKAPGEKPRWKYAFEIFTFEVWITWLLSSICLSVTLYVTKSDRKNARKLVNGLYIIFKLMVDQTVILKLSNHSHNIIKIVILLSTFLMKLFYESQFIFLLTGYKDSSTIRSTEDLMKNHFKIVAPDVVWYIFEGDRRFSTYLSGHYEESEFTLNITKDNIAVLNLKRIFLFEIKDHLDDEKRPKLKMLEEEVNTRGFGALLRRGDPLKNLMNRKLGLLFEHGFLSFIMSKYQSFRFERESPVRKSLTINSLQFPFIIWILGITLSVCILFYEIKG